jgi:hypothetical protein
MATERKPSVEGAEAAQQEADLRLPGVGEGAGSAPTEADVLALKIAAEAAGKALDRATTEAAASAATMQEAERIVEELRKIGAEAEGSALHSVFVEKVTFLTKTKAEAAGKATEKSRLTILSTHTGAFQRVCSSVGPREYFGSSFLIDLGNVIDWNAEPGSVPTVGEHFAALQTVQEAEGALRIAKQRVGIYEAVSRAIRSLPETEAEAITLPDHGFTLKVLKDGETGAHLETGALTVSARGSVTAVRTTKLPSSMLHGERGEVDTTGFKNYGNAAEGLESEKWGALQGQSRSAHEFLHKQGWTWAEEECPYTK